MLSLQEIGQKDAIKETYKLMEDNFEVSIRGGKKGTYDPYEANIYGTGLLQKQYGVEPLKPALAAQIRETVANTSLQALVEKAVGNFRAREFLAKSGTTGLMGAAYLIPDKVHQILFTSAVETDICAQVSNRMLGPDQIPGASIKIDVIVDGSYVPTKFSSGGSQAQMEFTTVQATLTPVSWGINFNIGNDLIEDAAFDVVAYHIQEAGREMGEYATNECLTIIGTAPDGDGTLNSGTSGDADETKWDGATVDVTDAYIGNTADGFVPDKMVTSANCWLHSIQSTMGAQYNEAMSEDRFYQNGLPSRVAGMDLYFSNVDYITNSQAFTNQKTLLFTNQYACITGRKRWLRIENYSDPVRDLVGATVTARQDTVTLYKDSIFTITET